MRATNSGDDKSTSVWVMAWCCQSSSHYLNQCWPRSLMPYDITRPQLGNCAWYKRVWSHNHIYIFWLYFPYYMNLHSVFTQLKWYIAWELCRPSWIIVFLGLWYCCSLVSCGLQLLFQLMVWHLCLFSVNTHGYMDGLVQDCSNSSALAMELLQSCTKPWIFASKHLVLLLV